jgi:hypothetical protein
MGIKVDIHVVLKQVLKKNQISTSNCVEPSVQGTAGGTAGAK